MNQREELRITNLKQLREYAKYNSNIEKYFQFHNNVTQMRPQNQNNQLKLIPTIVLSRKPVNQIRFRRSALENLSEEAYQKFSSNKNKTDAQKLNENKIDSLMAFSRKKQFLQNLETHGFEEQLYELCLFGAFVFFIISMIYTINKELNV